MLQMNTVGRIWSQESEVVVTNTLNTGRTRICGTSLGGARTCYLFLKVTRTILTSIPTPIQWVSVEFSKGD